MEEKQDKKHEKDPMETTNTFDSLKSDYKYLVNGELIQKYLLSFLKLCLLVAMLYQVMFTNYYTIG